MGAPIICAISSAVEQCLYTAKVGGSKPSSRTNLNTMHIHHHLKEKIDPLVVKQFIDEHPNSKVYIGCDSDRVLIKDEWYADYASVVVVHLGGRHGCKVFGHVERERDYEKTKARPRMRLMNEVYKVSQLYLDIAQVMEEDFDCEIHLDINPSEKHGSSCVINEAIGYVRALTNVVPMVKPNGFAATHCADRLKALKINCP